MRPRLMWLLPLLLIALPAAAGPVSVCPDVEPAWAQLTLRLSIAVLSIGGLSAVLGLWTGRDPDRPRVLAVAMTALIAAAILVGMVQSLLDEEDALETACELNDLRNRLEHLAEATGDEEITALVGTASSRPPSPTSRIAKSGCQPCMQYSAASVPYSK